MLRPLQESVLRKVKRWPGFTTSEIALRMNIRDPRRYGRRLTELEELGLVRRELGRCSITTRPCARWYATPAAQAA